MKRIPIFLIILFFILNCFGQKTTKANIVSHIPKRTDKVKSIIESGYGLTEKFGEPQKNFKGKASYFYNENGNLLEQIEERRDGSILHKFTLKYDDKDSLIEFIDMESGRTTYMYDLQGNNIEENIYKLKGDLDYKIKYKYDNKNKISEENHYSSDGALSFKRTFKYNDKGKITEEIQLQPDGIVYSKKIYKYDENGNKIEYYEQTNPESTLRLSESYK